MCELGNYGCVDLIIMVLALPTIKIQILSSVGGMFKELVIPYIELHNVFGAPVVSLNHVHFVP